MGFVSKKQGVYWRNEYVIFKSMNDASVSNQFEQEKILLEWKAPARPYRQHSKEFMTVPLIIAFLVGLVLIVSGEWILIAVVAALIFAYYTWSVVPPEMAEYKITTRGLRVSGKLYEWAVFTRWWIDEKWGHTMLCLETPIEVVRQVTAPLGELDSKRVTELMDRILLHERPEVTQIDKAGKWLAEKFPLEQKM